MNQYLHYYLDPTANDNDFIGCKIGFIVDFSISISKPIDGTETSD